MAYTANAWSVFVEQSHNGQPLGNVLAFTSASDIADPTDVANDVMTAWEVSNSFVDCQVVDVLYTQVIVRKLDGSLPGIAFAWVGSGSGNVVGDPVDPGSCLTYTLRTASGGKSHRGRLYLGGVGRGGLDSFSTAWDLSSSPGSTFAAAADVFLGAVAGGDANLTPCVNSRKLEELFPITSTVARTQITSQNQRARRYGVA